MSENIQSISQGTYTIGQTSATNFIAGPGISITQPSEGVVRIGNDETVLYENYTPSDTINLNEPATGFETLKVEMSATQAPAATEYYECIPGSAFAIGKVTLIPAAQYKLQIAGAYLTASNNYQTYKVEKAMRWYGNTTVNGGNDTTTLTANIKDAMYISRIWGINRISGGNE